jgi:hypothetical protein
MIPSSRKGPRCHNDHSRQGYAHHFTLEGGSDIVGAAHPWQNGDVVMVADEGVYIYSRFDLHIVESIRESPR